MAETSFMTETTIPRTFQNIREFWDWVSEHSFHLKQTKPTVTDIYYRHLVISQIFSLSYRKHGKVLKLDAYNEATNTQYGFYMLQKFEELTLVDISAGILKRAAERAQKKNIFNRMHFIAADFRRLPLRDECFDMSCSFGSIEHVEEYQRAFYEQVRVVKKGGDVFAGVPNISNFSFRILTMKVLMLLGLMKTITNPEKHFHRRQLKSLAEAMNLRDIVVSGYHLFPKQLRWLDLWKAQRAKNRVERGRLFQLVLKGFALMELRHPSVRRFAEMILVKGVRELEPGIEPRNLRDERLQITE
ncbi:MAG: class I SAM-dependent methyltransferase [Candidatus Caldarchaeum sp.]|nr:class I SAM-dependent methyltransferase [Candidatus Caldarchaeum sp.]